LLYLHYFAIVLELPEQAAIADLTRSRDSYKIRETLAKQDPGNADWQHNLAAGYERIGDVLHDEGDLANALETYRDSHKIREALAKQDPGNTEWQHNLAASYERIGDVLHDEGDLKGALESPR
jgi:tetratricopeptide (TPR) repeat protein